MRIDHPNNESTVAKEGLVYPLITEYNPRWRGPNTSSTHELVTAREFVFVSGQNMDQIAKFAYSGQLLTHYALPPGSGPHGLLLDAQGQLWVSLEFAGKILRLDEQGNPAEEIDVHMRVAGSATPINPAPHGICLGADGETIWFTGKRTSTIGRINPDKSVEHFALGTLAALPIFLQAGPDGHVWGTELLGSAILSISPAGVVREFKTPTPNSRPIGIVADPLAPCLWFSEEAGRKIGRIDTLGHIQEFTLPLLQPTDILASLSFDHDLNLWVQVYVDMRSPGAHGPDYLLCIDKAIRTSTDPYLFGIPISTHQIPSTMSMMHRIKTDPAGNLWFTEMMTDKLGKVTLHPA